MAHAVIRSVGGAHRPAFPVTIGADCLVGPAAALAGCTLEEAVYVATQVMVFHGARVRRGARLGAGCIVHTGAVVPERGRVGMRQFAVPAEHGDTVITADLAVARAHLAHADFFDRAFDRADDDQEELHRLSVDQLRREAADWDDLQPGP
jgi:carbonic anhydrase/acetyltransferase-like protein (isoleucine patch superfamily)